MNPFNLSGPGFLVFYALFSVLVLVVVTRIRNRNELAYASGLHEVQRRVECDPYLMAALCGGQQAIIQTVMVSLLERGLLTASEDGKTLFAPNAHKHLQPIEKAMLSLYANPGEAGAAIKDATVTTEAHGILMQVQDSKLWPPDVTESFRRKCSILATALLLGVACTKIAIAFSRGHTNVIFLILISVIAALYAWTLSSRPHSLFANTVVSRIRRKFGSLRSRPGKLRFNAHTGEVGFLVAIFGLGTAMAAVDENIANLLTTTGLYVPPLPSSGGSSYDSSYGSSSSCGSSCGGGGCGGCGGCG